MHLSDKYEQLKFKYALYMVLPFILLLWAIKFFEIISGSHLMELGILPRTLRGVAGIFTGPLIHGDIFHLISNSLPLLLLGMLLFYFYHRIALEIFLWIYFVSGFWTWLLAREAWHIGASGLVYGIASFLFMSGIIRRNRQLMSVSGVILFLYGGIIYGMFPGMVDVNISWEAHLAGALTGVILAFLFRKTKVDAEQEESHDDDEDDRPDDEYFSSPEGTEDVEVHYSFKPDDRDIGN